MKMSPFLVGRIAPNDAIGAVVVVDKTGVEAENLGAQPLEHAQHRGLVDPPRQEPAHFVDIIRDFLEVLGPVREPYDTGVELVPGLNPGRPGSQGNIDPLKRIE